MWCTHTHTHTHTHTLIHNETLLSHKNKWNIIYSNMDRPGDYHTKWNKWKKDKYYMTLLICVYKKIYNLCKWTYLQSGNRLTEEASL